MLHRDISEGNVMYDGRSGRDHFVLIDFDLAGRVDEHGLPKKATSRRHTGTLPFMAYDLVYDMSRKAIAQAHGSSRRGSQCGSAESTMPGNEQVDRESVTTIHCVRHDFESVLWLCLWCAVKTVDPSQHRGIQEAQKRYENHLAAWETGTYTQIADNKSCWLATSRYIDAVECSPCFEHLRSWMSALWFCFSNGRNVHNSWMMLRHRRKAERDLAKLDFPRYESWHGKVTKAALMAELNSINEIA